MSILLQCELQAQGCLEVRREFLDYGFDSAVDIIYTLGDTIFDDMRIWYDYRLRKQIPEEKLFYITRIV